MAKKKAISADYHGVLSDVALLAMRNYEDSKRDKDGLYGLAAALVFVNTLGLELPDWAKSYLVTTQYLTVFAGGTHRQDKLRRKMGTFLKDLTRYVCVLTCDEKRNPVPAFKMETFIKVFFGQKLSRRESAQFIARQAAYAKSPAKKNCSVPLEEQPGKGRGWDKFEDAFERAKGGWAATEDSSGMKQSYYRFERMFRSKSLASYVAIRVTEVLMSRSPVL